MNTVINQEILLAQPRGFCAGVDRAILIVERALKKFGPPIYVKHEIVHNTYIVNHLKEQGAIFVDDISEIPIDSIVIFSAHGVSPVVRLEASQRKLKIFDATCPLVTKVHAEVKKMKKNGMKILMIGHKDHPEVEGTIGQAPDSIQLIESITDVENLDIPKNIPISYVTQTTLSIDETTNIVQSLRKKYPHIVQSRKQDICYATQNRQDAVKSMATQVDIIIVVGSPNSSNSNRLYELAKKLGVHSYMIDHPNQLDLNWFKDKRRIGITAGASAPESLAKSIVERIQSFGPRSVRTMHGIVETLSFSLPRELS